MSLVKTRLYPQFAVYNEKWSIETDLTIILLEKLVGAHKACSKKSTIRYLKQAITFIETRVGHAVWDHIKQDVCAGTDICIHAKKYSCIYVM